MVGIVSEEQVNLASVPGKGSYRHPGEVEYPAVHQTRVEHEDIAEGQCRQEEADRGRFEQSAL